MWNRAIKNGFMDLKVCYKCEVEKSVDLFSQKRNVCKACESLRLKTYRKLDPAKLKLDSKQWRKNRIVKKPDVVKHEKRIQARKSREMHRNILNEKSKKRTKKRTAQLEDGYIKMLLGNKEINESIINLKRLEVKLKRKIYETERTIINS
jgi:hypothetical protein